MLKDNWLLRHRCGWDVSSHFFNHPHQALSFGELIDDLSSLWRVLWQVIGSYNALSNGRAGLSWTCQLHEGKKKPRKKKLSQMHLRHLRQDREDMNRKLLMYWLNTPKIIFNHLGTGGKECLNPPKSHRLTCFPETKDGLYICCEKPTRLRVGWKQLFFTLTDS